MEANMQMDGNGPRVQIDDIVPKGGPPLSEEQQRVLELVIHGHSVFFTGPAGTGKSVLLKAIIDCLKSRYAEAFEQFVPVTASTGIAALNIGGRTLHSFAGLGYAKERKEKLLKRLGGFAKLRWKDAKILIIDEISMVDGSFFDKLDFIAKKVRDNDAPFGGIQLVICGDFFQLPPVPDKSHERITPITFAFNAEAWPSAIQRTISLTQVFRQKDDVFIQILNNIRYNTLKETDIECLQSLSRPLPCADDILPTELYPLRAEVQKCNDSRLDALPGDPLVFRATDSAGYDIHGCELSEKQVAPLLERLIALPVISLKVGAQVMLIQNIETDLVNGSRGVVTKFLTVREAWLAGIDIADPPSRLSRPQHVLQPTDNLNPMPMQGVFGRHTLWPLVRFKNGRDLLCVGLKFTCEGPLGNIEASRTQVPLILSWAMSVHKSQGQTLETVKMDLGRAFEKGQVYVALSRATSMDGLQLVNFEPSRVMAHPDVIDWHRKCVGVEIDEEEEYWRGYGDLS